MISTANITMQFGARPLFENVSIKFGNGHRYGLIGANGCGKSTFMKILGGDLEPSSGQVMVESGARLGKLRQDQFAFEDERVIDTVIMGNHELWQVAAERERIYALPEMSEEDGMAVADLEVRFAELDGYTAESRSGDLLLGLGIPLHQHTGPMGEIAPGWKLRVLLAQALFADPDVLLLDELTNHLDINTIRWLEAILNARNSTMIIISHDRHFLNSVCTRMADLDYGEITLFPGNYDDYMTAATAVRERQHVDNAKKKAQIADLQAFVSRFSANASKAKQATSRARQIDKSVMVISGGEQGRMLFGKLALTRPNVLLMDEPTNHLDMESIEALNLALANYPGTLIFVSHDREFVSSLATRIIDMGEEGVTDFSGGYDEYLRSQGLYS
ncbi:ATP-binding cassette domain-containing protein [Halomonas sp.]|uniref:ATP-binding cassette domain-containing protein n=1 Tax=Halomonas sp. TaxID=1486246 RepID=UPI0035694D5F